MQRQKEKKATKMVLVPHDEFTELRDRIMAELRNPETDRTISLQKQLNSQPRDIPDDIQYRNLQSVYSDFVNQIKKLDNKDTEKDFINRGFSQPVSTYSKSTMPAVPDIYDQLLDHVPVKNKSRYSRVVDVIRRNPSLIAVEPDGSVRVKGVLQKGSNINDLLYKALNLKSRGDPAGYANFIDALAQTNLGAHNILDPEGQSLFSGLRLGNLTDYRQGNRLHSSTNYEKHATPKVDNRGKRRPTGHGAGVSQTPKRAQRTSAEKGSLKRKLLSTTRSGRKTKKPKSLDPSVWEEY